MHRARGICRALTGKDFRQSEGAKHTFLSFYNATGQKTPVYTRVSRGTSELGAPIVLTMAQQRGLSLRDFDRLVTCALEQRAYESLLRSNGHIEWA